MLIIDLHNFPDTSTKKVFGVNFSSFKIFFSSEKTILYANSSNEIFVLVSNKGKNEIVKSVIYVSALSKLPHCLTEKLDAAIQTAINTSALGTDLPDKEDFYFFITTYLNYSKFSWNKANLDQFSQLLKEAQNSKGYIIVYAGKESKRNETSFWIKELKRYLVEKNKVEEKKLFFIDGGYRENAVATLFILPNTAPFPQPTPTILQNQFRSIKSNKVNRGNK